MTYGNDRTTTEYEQAEQHLKWVVADLRQKLQDERDGAEEALKAKDTVIAELQLRCSNLERELERWWEMEDAEADAQEGFVGLP